MSPQDISALHQTLNSKNEVEHDMCLFCNRDVNALNWVPRNWLQNSSDMPWIMPWLQNSLSTQFHQHLLDHCSWVPRPFSGRRDALSWSIRCMLGGRSSVIYNIYIYIYNYIHLYYRYNILYILYIIPNISYMLYDMYQNHATPPAH
jgi:hypothetical protein